jgi:type II secretory ATPase GspE/PulE/Tfp pilus assembly ATPase PilB-like protein/CheY-like chemotaxis protein
VAEGGHLIVCIDNDAQTLMLLERMLANDGYRVRTARSGGEGIKVVRESRPALVLLDLMMPDMDGFETCSKLQQDPKTQNTPVIILTASISEDDRLKAFSAGAVDFFVKPLARQVLRQRMPRYLELSSKWSSEAQAPVAPARKLNAPSRFQEFRQYLSEELSVPDGKQREVAGMSSRQLYDTLSSAGISAKQTARLIAEFLEVEYKAFLNPKELCLGVLPISFCRANSVVPIIADEGVYGIAVANPFDRELMDLLASKIPDSDEVTLLISDPESFRIFFSRVLKDRKAADKGAPAEQQVQEDIFEVIKKVKPPVAQLEIDEESEVQDADSDLVRLVHRIIIDAHEKEASDIHLEPTGSGEVTVRYRIDGVLVKALDFPRHYLKAAVSRIKIMAALDITQRHIPQSGKIAFKRWGDLDIELRVETYPTVAGGEDVSLRILSQAKALSLEDLYMSPANIEEFKRIISQPYGLVLCVGPTGSGKTTTLHSALRHINRDDIRILTVEDPVEVTQPGLRQVQVNVKAGRTFPWMLRSFLRADPDVIMIGEMRDKETAVTAVEASLTGHLVFSTLHTNNAPETIARLLNMGIDQYSFADSLLEVLAQRLVRKLCPECKQAVRLDDEGISVLRVEYGSDRMFSELGVKPGATIYRKSEKGCKACRGFGFRGRMPIHELFVVTDEIKNLIYHKAKAMDLRNIGIEQGMKLLKQDGIEKVLAGHTTIEEIRAACGT